MIIKHYEVFKTKFESEKLNQKNWDILRTESGEIAYAIEDNRDEYEENCIKSISYEYSAKSIIEVLKKYECKHIVSLGVGKGILEWHLKKQMPDLFIECTDYAEAAIEKLEKVFIEGDGFYKFDMLKGDYKKFDKNAFFVMYRVSEEFCFSDWKKVFQKMSRHGVNNIIYIPDMLATEELSAQLKRRHDKHIERGLLETFCGWIYSEDVLEEMFLAGGYEIIEKHQMGELVLYLLELIKHSSNCEEE